MTLQHNLVRNPTFADWTAGSADVWEEVSTTNATITQLSRTDAPEDPKRRVFTIDRGNPYIYDGPSSYRVTMAAAGSADEFELRQKDASAAGVLVNPGQRYSLTLVARSTVDDNLLTVGIVGLVGTTDTLMLQVENNDAYHAMGNRFEWTVSSSLDAAVDIGLKGHWQKFGFQFEIPENITSVSWRIANGSAGAYVFDLGSVSLYEQSYQIKGD